MPRGSGKTSLTEAAALWSLLFGFRRYVVLVGATAALAAQMLESIKVELETNDRLFEDFPSACFPIRRLEGTQHKRLISRGKRIEITLGATELRLPWIEDGGRRNGVEAGAIVQCVGITGSVRGMKQKQRDGKTIRPDFVILDDPQTDESAISPPQIARREKVIKGAVLGLAGPGNKISAVMPCTVIEEGDLADRILDQELNPDWNAERIPMVKSFPERLELWEEYGEIRVRSLKQFDDIRLATEYYKTNREEMDRGAVVSWEARFEADEISAIQNAMNLKLKDEESFWSEYQQNPRRNDDEELRLQTPKVIAKRLNGIDVGRSIPGAGVVSAFVDVQQKALFYVVCSWREDFSGGVARYGTWPEQPRKYYSLSDINRTIKNVYKGSGIDGGITAAIRDFIPDLAKRTFPRENDELDLRPSIIMIDANWKTSVVREAIRSLKLSNVFPSHGRFIGASSNPMEQWKQATGDKIGRGWKTSTIERMNHVLFDSNFWKSFVHERLATEFGDGGSLMINGTDEPDSRLISEHLTAEYRVRVKASNGREVDEWKHKATKPDNHFFDGVVGCCVGANMLGATRPELGAVKRRKRRRTRYY